MNKAKSQLNTNPPSLKLRRGKYDVFGSVVGKSGLAESNYLFTNQEYDSESELYYYNARYYNPTTGRFISRDPFLGRDGDVLSKNSYIYVKNNPLKYVDPTGEIEEEIKKQLEEIQNNTANGLYIAMAPGAILGSGFAASIGLLLDDATIIGIADDILIPFILIGASLYAAYEAVQTVDVDALTKKMTDEISRIKEKVKGPMGIQYSLRATISGNYHNETTGGSSYLKAGEVWKYGETTKPETRYAKNYLGQLRVVMVREFAGTQIECKVIEKTKIYSYFFAHGHLPPGNKIFR
ncbi:MAG: RHS repeat-associated core domain-containing protein [Candidatus Magasanikbacteria bacterium]